LGHIYLYTGTGGGKTTNALGLALRSVGHRYKVVIIQFMKWWKNTGEYKIRRKLAPYYEIYQFGRKGWIGLNNLTEEDKKLAEEALEFTKKIVKEKKPHLLVLDEINLAVHYSKGNRGCTNWEIRSQGTDRQSRRRERSR